MIDVEAMAEELAREAEVAGFPRNHRREAFKTIAGYMAAVLITVQEAAGEPQPPTEPPSQPPDGTCDVHKDKGRVTHTCWLSAGGNARYDFSGTTCDNSYNPATDTYTPSFNIRVSKGHKGGGCFGFLIMNGYRPGEPPVDREYPDNHGGQFLFKDVPGLEDFTIESGRFHHTWDPIRFASGCRDTCRDITIKGCWFSDTFDDAIENDVHVPGIKVIDCLFERTFILVSDRIDTPTNWGSRVMTFRDNVIGLHRMYKSGVREPLAQFFKLNAQSISFDLFDNVFYSPRAGDGPGGGNPFHDLMARGKLRESSGNRIVWGGSGPYPFEVPKGFEVTPDAQAWTAAAAKWKADHPKVRRIEGVD